MRTQAALPIFLMTSLACSSSPKTEVDAGINASDSGVHPDASQLADSGQPTDAAEPDSGQAACPTLDGEVITLNTEDGQALEADLYTTGASGGPAVVLLHMIPPSNTRSNYPRAFIDALVQRGLTVINVDRRGAGGDPALARTAYTGPNGKWDAKAAIDYLTSHACALDPSRLAIVGASNGTTTAFDYAVYAAGEATAPSPAALVFLTGGGYTETNNQISSQRTVLDPLPLQFVFSTAERDWSAGFEAGAPATWSFEEYDPGAHGTRMLTTRSESVAAVADFLQSKLQ